MPNIPELPSPYDDDLSFLFHKHFQLPNLPFFMIYFFIVLETSLESACKIKMEISIFINNSIFAKLNYIIPTLIHNSIIFGPKVKVRDEKTKEIWGVSVNK